MGETIELQGHPDVFSPSSHGLAFAEILNVDTDEKTVDVGCGTGIFAIAAAMRGAIVTAIDPNAHAIRLTKRNAAANNVSVETVQGMFFAGLRREFDVIIANLPQDIVHPSTLMKLSRLQRMAISAGPYGDAAIRHLLSCALNHMHAESRLYTVVYTGARHEETQALINKHFHVSRKHTSTVACKDHVGENSDFYEKLRDQGVIDIFRRRGEWHAHQHEYELHKKK